MFLQKRCCRCCSRMLCDDGLVLAVQVTKYETTAQVLRNGEWLMLPSAQLVPGDAIRVPSNWLMPCDCIIVQGQIPSAALCTCLMFSRTSSTMNQWSQHGTCPHPKFYATVGLENLRKDPDQPLIAPWLALRPIYFGCWLHHSTASNVQLLTVDISS